MAVAGEPAVIGHLLDLHAKSAQEDDDFRIADQQGFQVAVRVRPSGGGQVGIRMSRKGNITRIDTSEQLPSKDLPSPSRPVTMVQKLKRGVRKKGKVTADQTTEGEADAEQGRDEERDVEKEDKAEEGEKEEGDGAKDRPGSGAPKRRSLAGGADGIFEFPFCYGPRSEQGTVYSAFGPGLVRAALAGFNASLLAYGQTGSGKTHTMMGDDSVPPDCPSRISFLLPVFPWDIINNILCYIDQEKRPNYSNEGIIPRLCMDLFRQVNEKRVRVSVSYVQIYNEKVYDLLAPPKGGKASGSAKSKKVVARKKSADGEDDESGGEGGEGVKEKEKGKEKEKEKGVRKSSAPSSKPGQLGGGPMCYKLGVKKPSVPQLRTVEVHCSPTGAVSMDTTTANVSTYEEVRSLIKLGNKCRATAATVMNERSSRSHAIFTLYLSKCQGKTTKEGKIHLVDLAGSERAGEIATDDERLAEGCHINLSLMTFGRVVSALQCGQGHVPYRDSILTQLLRDSLGGNALSYMIATVSPLLRNVKETRSTLFYAHRCSKIQSTAVANERSTALMCARAARKLHQIRETLGELRAYLTEVNKKLRSLRAVPKPSVAESRQLLEYEAKVEELRAKIAREEGARIVPVRTIQRLDWQNSDEEIAAAIVMVYKEFSEVHWDSIGRNVN